MNRILLEANSKPPFGPKSRVVARRPILKILHVFLRFSTLRYLDFETRLKDLKWLPAIFLLSVMPTVAFCEMPVTTVKPDKAAAYGIDFAINVVDENLNDPGRFKYQTLILTVHIQDREKWRISEPVVLVMNGKNFVCRAILDKVESGYEIQLGKNPDGAIRYWLEISPDYIANSTIRISKYPVAPDKTKELCVQSMEYVLELKDYIKKKPNKDFE